MSVVTEDPIDIEKTIAFSNRMATYQNQIRLARSKFQAETVVSFNGGNFRVTEFLLGTVKHKVDAGSTKEIVLDENDIPIIIENLISFLDTISSVYYEKLNEYFVEVQRLKSAKTIMGMVEGE